MKLRAQISFLAVLIASGCTPVGPQDAGPTPLPIGPGTLNVADAAIAGGDPSMALSVTQSVLATDPHNVDALVHEGDAYYALSRCNSAEAAYQLALGNDPKSTASEVGLGRCLLKTNPQAAEIALLEAVQDDPGNAAAFNDLGIARDLQGNFAGAVAPYQEALQADPALTAAEVNLGLSLALSGNGAAALQYLGPLATGQGATPKIREDYAAALVASGRDPEAREVLAVDLPPDDVNRAIAGFAAVIAGAQAPLPPAAASPTPKPVIPAPGVLQTAPIAAAPLPGSPPQAAAVAPPPMLSDQTYTPDHSTGAYSGASPLPVAAAPSAPAPHILQAAAMVPAAPPPPAVTAFKAAAGAPVDDPPDSAAAGFYQVQIAALNSQPDAALEWSRVTGAMPALFSGKRPDIVSATVNGKVYYRLRTGSFDSKAGAAKFCGEVAAGGTPCTVANF